MLAGARPVTPLGQRLLSLRGAAGKRLRGAQELAACPASLIDDLLESASALAEVDVICVAPTGERDSAKRSCWPPRHPASVSASPRPVTLVRRVTLLSMERRPGSLWHDAIRL